jgi:PA14 domain
VTVRRTQPRPDQTPHEQDTQIVPAYYAEEEPASRGISGYTVAVLTLLALAVVCVLAILVIYLLKRNAPVVPPVNGTGTPVATLVGPGQTATPGVPGQAQITVNPSQGHINTLVTVTGQGWWPQEPVFVFLRSPQEGTGRGFSYAAAVADESGNIRTAFTFPNEARWVGQLWADVIGRGTRSTMEAITRFTLVAPTATNTAPVPTFPPTNTPTPVLPTDTPTPTGTPTPTPTSTALVITDWRGEYFANRDLAGNPVLVRNDGYVEFNWGEGSPGPTVPVNGFSARWTRSRQFREGTFRFSLTADDGVRLWVDNTLLINEWHDGLGTYTEDLHLAQGVHALRIEYYENTGGAMIQFDWQQVEEPTATPTPTPTAGTPTPPSIWHGEYFANPDLDGPPVYVQEYTGEGLSLDWGLGSPSSQVPSDYFSARWTQIRWFAAGNYRFHLTVDDGGRVWVDNHRLIRAWDGGPVNDVTEDIYLDEGLHSLRVEYHEVTDQAHIIFWIERLGR